MEEPERARSVVDLRAPSFQVRFIKKLSNIRTRFGRKDSSSSNGGRPYQRQTRSMSMDIRHTKPQVSPPEFLTMPRSSEMTDRMEDSPISGTSSASPSTMRQSSSDVEREERPRSVDARNTGCVWLLPSASSPGVQQTRSPPQAVMSSPNGQSGPSLPPSLASNAPVADSQSRLEPLHTPLSVATTSMSTAQMQALQLPTPSPNTPGRRSPAPRLASLPAPPTRFNIEGGSARLSPSVISRRPPFPILNLPSISTATPGPSQPRRIRPQSRLSSMPALPREGPDDYQHQADHGNAMLAESDEEEDMEGEGEGEGEEAQEGDMGSDDEEGDEGATGRPSESSYRDDGLHDGLPAVETSPFDLLFLNAKKDGTKTFTVGEMTPTARRALDYFSAKPIMPDALSPGRTPKPGEVGSHQALLVPPTPSSPRPKLYQQASKSMIDLMSPKANRPMGADQVKPPEHCPLRTPAIEGVSSPKPALPPKEHETLPPYLRRQRSMPTFNPSTEPPPYPAFFPMRRKGPVVQPREEEGREKLPTYTNSIYIAAIMPRKMEFSGPGEQAKDRKWRRVYCVLEGTMFRVYKCPPGASGVNPVTEWWEKKVGVGDATNTAGVSYDGRIRLDTVRPKERMERPPKLGEEGRSESSTSRSGGTQEEGQGQPQPKEHAKSKRFSVNLLHPSRGQGNSNSTSRFGRSSLDSTRGETSGRRPSLTLTRPVSHSSASSSAAGSSSQASSSQAGGAATHSTSLSPTSAGGVSSSRSHFRLSHNSTRSSSSSELPPPDSKDLLRVYSLQHAESGLGSDYLKRRNVIRVRMEGEQFLLQASDVAAVVDWIEGFQAATNIALDLDERPMPKGPMFPRRRRRRVRRPEEAGLANAAGAPTGTRPP